METEPLTTAIIRVTPLSDESVVALAQEVNSILSFAQARVITEQAHVVNATDDLSFLAKLKKAIEEKRKEYVTPINDHLKAINDAFKTLSTPLEQADTLTRSKIMAYRSECERKAKEIEEINRLRVEAAQREASLNDGEIKEPIQIMDVPETQPSTVHTDIGTLGMMKVRKWEVEDLAKVPTEYLMIDSTKVGKVVRAGIPGIPGIRIWVEETLKVSAK